VLTRVVQASHAKPYVALALTLDLTLVHELAAEIDAASDEPQSMIAVGEADDALLGAMDRLFGLVDKPQAAPTLSPLIRREIHYWLLAARHGAMLRALARPDSHAARVARATALIQRGYAETLRVPELARAAGMSASAFHEHFKAITGLTPLQYQKQLRLTKARQLLIGDGETVSGAAFAVGYESPTQFSREYSRRFGASPRADVAAHAHAGGLEPMAVQP
jgi:AraC-like DNA-binding protein